MVGQEDRKREAYGSSELGSKRERTDLQEARGVIISELLTVQGSKAADSCLKRTWVLRRT